MKPLHSSFAVEKDKHSAHPYLVVEIQYDPAIGTKYYSDRVLSSPATETDLLINGPSITLEINEDKGNCSGVTVDISDVGKTILGYLRQKEIYKKTIKIWQCFEGVLWANQTAIWQGTVKTATRKEQTESVSFSCESLQANYDGKLGTNTTESTAKKEGEVLPIVYGKVNRSKCVQIIESKRTALVVPLKVTGTTAIVSDSREFSQGNYQKLWIGQELVRGKFVGCKLTIAQRACVVATGYTTWNQPNLMTFRANLSPQGFSWVGYTIKFWKTPATWFERVISNYTSPDIYGMKSAATVPAGTYYEIYTPATNHDTGEEVYENLSEYKWVLNDAVSTNVEYIEILGSVAMEGENTSSKMKEVETYVRLDDRYMTVNLNDGGQTTVSLPFDPKHLRNQPYKNTDLLATMTGINYSNPVDIIVDLAQKLGLSHPGDFDLVSIASERTKIDWLKMGITITDRLVFEVLFDIAFQARLSLKLTDKLYFKYLQNKAGTSIKDVSDADRVFDSLEITQDEVVANKIECSFGQKDERFEISDAASIAAYGEKTKSIQLWCIQEKVYAEGIANFWLRRWAWPLEKARLSTFLNSFEMDLNDWITLDSTGNYSDQPAEVVRVENQPAGGEIDKINYELRLPRWAGCASSCEQYEETGCSSTCEQYCTSSAQTSCGYACETSDQTACSLTCVTTCELECTTYYQMSGNDTSCKTQCQTSCTSGCQTSGCQTACTLGCQTGCTTGEQAGCETSCEIACEVACETGGQVCEGSCETSCQIGCQTGAETTCNSGCETGCQGECQSGCTTGCTGACTTGSETCALSCQACCEHACQDSCEQYCAGTCQSSCTADIQAVSFTACTRSCETSCQGSCEGSCQSCCQFDGTETTYTCDSQCQTACINVCQTSAQTFSGGGSSECATQCEAYCMTSAAQAGCALYCTVGCMCDCEATCEGACRTGCETNCQCECQTDAQSAACTTSSEGACYASCQAYNETHCVTSCEATCQAYCRIASEGATFCMTGCQCDCQGSCELGCRTGCETTCQCLCQTGAQTSNTCATAAQVGDTCYTACRDYCRTVNQTSGCVTGCQSFCMTGGGCQAGACTAYCMTGCQCDCEHSCRDFCRTGCETDCRCACMTNTYQVDSPYSCGGTSCVSACMSASQSAVACKTTCQLSACTTACQDYCRTANQTSGCVTGCQSFCMTGGGCQAGACTAYCMTGCQCDCMASCQSFCRTGCEAACMCLCQTAAQV